MSDSSKLQRVGGVRGGLNAKIGDVLGRPIEKRASKASVDEIYLGRKLDDIPSIRRMRRNNDFFSKKR